MKKHQKHAKLIKPAGGKFHRNEWAIIGAPCSIIKDLAQRIAFELLDSDKVAFVDEVHQEQKMNSPFHQEIVHRLTFLDNKKKHSSFPFSLRTELQSTSFALINGNHFKAAQQIVLIHPAKKDSLHRKLDRLTQVVAIILCEEENEPYSFLENHISAEVPIFRLTEYQKIAGFIHQQVMSTLPLLHGLVLAGGKSQRMGRDKASLIYHKETQLDHTYRILHARTDNTYVSVAPKNGTPYSDLEDTFIGLGPYGGLLSAFRNNPNNALLTLPIDVPLVDGTMLDLLIEKRDPQKLATCFFNPETNFPEPLITIWEPHAYPVLLYYLSLGYSCPRKVLINEDVLVIDCPWPEKMKNANTEDERLNLLKTITQSDARN